MTPAERSLSILGSLLLLMQSMILFFLILINSHLNLIEIHSFNSQEYLRRITLTFPSQGDQK